MIQSSPALRPVWPDPDTLDDGAVMACFESLGGHARGGEFGAAQSQYGADRIGLLRSANLGPDFLVHALTQRFEGVGTTQQTIVFKHERDAEWWTRDVQYWMATRSTVRIDDVPEAKARIKLQRRLTFLARKMIADLEAADRVFVYRDLHANLDAGMRGSLLRAIRAFGETPLLILQYAEPPAMAGDVEEIEPGLFLGHLAHFAFSPDNRPLGPVHAAILAICRKTIGLLADGAPARSLAPAG